MRPYMRFTVLAFALTTLAQPAAAYIGPGMGAGAVTAVLGVVAAVFMAFVALLWYPLKRMFKAKKTTDDKPAEV